MRKTVALTLLAALLLPAVAANSSYDKAKCEKVKQQIREIEAKMRAGYSAAQGIRYDDRLRKLKDKRYAYCR